jgi:hypothetical protein
MNKDDFGILPIFDRKFANELKLLRKTLWHFSLGGHFMPKGGHILPKEDLWQPYCKSSNMMIHVIR